MIKKIIIIILTIRMNYYTSLNYLFLAPKPRNFFSSLLRNILVNDPLLFAYSFFIYFSFFFTLDLLLSFLFFFPLPTFLPLSSFGFSLPTSLAPFSQEFSLLSFFFSSFLTSLSHFSFSLFFFSSPIFYVFWLTPTHSLPSLLHFLKKNKNIFP